MKLNLLSFRKLKNVFLNYLSFVCNSERMHKLTFPLFVSIESAAVCNLHCPECPAGLKAFKRAPFMDFSLFKKIVDEIHRHALQMLLYFQGEPLLNPKIFEMIRYANNKNLYTYLSTNAQTIDQMVSEKLVASQLRHLIISIDGTTQLSYEKYRQGGSLAKAICAIENINAERKKQHSRFPKIEVQFVVFRHNEHEINDIKRLARQWGADSVSIKTAQIYDFDKKPEMIPTQTKYSRYVFRNGHWQLKKTLRNRCFRSWAGAVVNSEGDVVPCCFDKKCDFVFGNVRHDTLHAIWHSAKAIAFRRQIRHDRKVFDICTNCTE